MMLRNLIPTAKDLSSVRVGEINSPLVNLGEALPEVRVQYLKKDMIPYTGNAMFVRRELISSLRLEGNILDKLHPGAMLDICYAYRHPKVQRDYFNQRFTANQKVYPELSEPELIELTHTQVAVPSVAGHPTGGAVDLTIIGPDGVPLDMGTDIADYSEPAKCYTFAEGLTKEQVTNRQLLRYIMLQAGFAPFDGEWWHFSYGDREWAFYYGYPASLYSQIERTFVGCNQSV